MQSEGLTLFLPLYLNCFFLSVSCQGKGKVTLIWQRRHDQEGHFPEWGSFLDTGGAYPCYCPQFMKLNCLFCSSGRLFTLNRCVVCGKMCTGLLVYFYKYRLVLCILRSLGCLWESWSQCHLSKLWDLWRSWRLLTEHKTWSLLWWGLFLLGSPYRCLALKWHTMVLTGDSTRAFGSEQSCS